MNFIKRMIIGGMIATAAAMVCADGMCAGKRKMMKKGKQLARRMGII